MTIDEAIAKEKYRSDRMIEHSQLHCVTQEFFADIEYHKQLAEWLELLKWYQQGMEDIPSESGVLPRDVYRAGYNKAVDDFEKMAKEVKYQDGALSNIDLEYIAERLKAGDDDA